MTSKFSIRSFSAITRPVRRRAQCAQSPRVPPCISHQFSTSSPATEERWSRTPPAMVAPVRHRPGKPFAVNTNPALLNKMYNLFLGPGGDRWLSNEVKWLAVTHKSFDHGRRGFNDRMAYLGMLYISPIYPGFAVRVDYWKLTISVRQTDHSVTHNPCYHKLTHQWYPRDPRHDLGRFSGPRTIYPSGPCWLGKPLRYEGRRNLR